MRDAALLLLGHGSTLNADSSAPTYQHASELIRRKVFGDVQVAFWKEEPNFRQALRQTRERKVYVVPNFISSGYFTEQVIPRELGLTGPITQIGDKRVFYCSPIGLHPGMTEVLLKRAHDVVAMSRQEIACPRETACLFICGHGTSLNDNSTKIIHQQVEIIRARGLYADCQGVLMEQRPFVKDWRTLTDCPDVIVVPFFISDGLHSYEDIPRLLGMKHDRGTSSTLEPHLEKGRRLWYANAIGTEPSMADLILAQVQAFDDEHRAIKKGRAKIDNCFPPFKRFARAREQWTIGEVLVRREFNFGVYLIMQRDDADRELKELRSIDFEELRQVIRDDMDGKFRPLRAAPSLQGGWVLRTMGERSVQQVLDYLYPAEIANWALGKTGELPVTPWRETAERQTGRFRIVRELGDEGVRELAAQVCDRGCLKRRLWSPCAQEVVPAPDEIPLLCPEACNYLVSKAREKLKGPESDAE